MGWLGNAIAISADLSSPRAGGHAAGLDEVLEALQVAFDAARHESEFVPDGLDEPGGLERELQHHLRVVVVEAMERHDAGVVGAVTTRPRNALVRDLLGDLGVPLGALATDDGDPVQRLVVDLTEVFDVLHEARKLFELRPLVVNVVNRTLYLD